MFTMFQVLEMCDRCSELGRTEFSHPIEIVSPRYLVLCDIVCEGATELDLQNNHAINISYQ
jgi:hypothetical protein